MPFFNYRARDKEGSLVTGSLEAPSRNALEINLDKMGLIPIKVSTRGTLFGFTFPELKKFFQRVTDQDLILFSRQLATLFGAGVPLTRALSTLESQMENPAFVETIKTVREDVEGGETFARALSSHPKVFPELYSNMVEAGEAGGILDGVLNRLAHMLERNAENRAKIKSATLYPKIVVGALVVAIIVLMNFVVPRFAQLYSSFNVPLPLATRALIFLSMTFISYWYVLVIIAAALYLAARFYLSTARGRYNWDRMVLKFPVFGPLRLKSILARFARILGGLYKSGLPILQSLDIVSRAVENRAVASSVKSIEDEVRSGKDLSEPLSASPYFPPIVVQMVTVGEETGNLDDMLEKVSQYYDQEVDSTIRNLTTILEPILLSFIFAVVLFLALSIFLPMWDLMKLVRR